MAWKLRKLIGLTCGLAVFSALGGAADAALFVVTKTADSADGACDGDCSLREAVIASNAAPGPDVVLVEPGSYILSLAGAPDSPAVGDLDLDEDVILYGESAATTVIHGAGHDRLLDVAGDAVAEVVGIMLSGGRASEGGGGVVRNRGVLRLRRSVVMAGSLGAPGLPGGGIWSSGEGSELEIEASTISGNTATGDGGGIAVDGRLTLVNSTVSGNSAPAGSGGGLYAFADTDAVVVQSTITANSAAESGGGIFGDSVPFISVERAHLRGSIVARNSAPTDRDCAGAVASDGGNLLGDGEECIDFVPGKGDLEGTAAAPLDPFLAELANNGGSTSTHALLAASPALDRLATCEAFDQRGQERPAGAACDIGAFEVGSDCLSGGPTLCLNASRFRVTARWRLASGPSGDGLGIPLTSDSGLFWFFDPDNVELTVKVLNGCGVNNRHWVFLSGLTNVEVTVTVTDTATGAVKTYLNPLNRNFRPVFDTVAFATCP
jgi:CSLREA domain-containing protein